jgi:hypothetical protein
MKSTAALPPIASTQLLPLPSLEIVHRFFLSSSFQHCCLLLVPRRRGLLVVPASCHDNHVRILPKPAPTEMADTMFRIEKAITNGSRPGLDCNFFNLIYCSTFVCI